MPVSEATLVPITESPIVWVDVSATDSPPREVIDLTSSHSRAATTTSGIKRIGVAEAAAASTHDRRRFATTEMPDRLMKSSVADVVEIGENTLLPTEQTATTAGI